MLQTKKNKNKKLPKTKTKKENIFLNVKNQNLHKIFENLSKIFFVVIKNVAVIYFLN